jgi:hypothetical protein
MDDRLWMYQDSSQGLRRMNYCNGVQGFINFATSIPINFTRGGIRHFIESCKIFTGNASPTLIPTETVRWHLSAVQNYRQNHRQTVRIPKGGH